MKTCVLGATGAVGTPITNFFENKGPVLKLNSRNCNLNDINGIPDFSFTNCDVFINAFGTFGGLKSYESGAIELDNHCYNNLSSLIDQLNPSTVINISSASVSNKENHKSTSTYYEYVKIKKKIEELISNKNIDSIVHLRCTNIISKYENFKF